MESIAKISSLMETARELTLDAAQATRGARTSSRPLDRNQMRKLLDSRNDRDVLEGLRRVMAMMYRNHKTLPLFSNVVKNVASPNLEIKKLVYIYLIHHAEQEPDLALLSINTIQKSLSDTNPQVRALALKTMSGIRVPVISQIVSLAIKKGVADMSPYVRKAAALAIPKCHRLDPTQAPQLIEYLTTLLGDKQYYVAGAAVSAMLEICPERIDLIHKHYRTLIKQVVDMDEWSQLATLRMMTYYARKCFPRRSQPSGETDEQSKDAHVDDFYGESRDSGRSTGATVLDPDLALLLNGIKPLLQSRNAGVVVAVTRCYVDLGTPEYVKLAIGPLIALLRGAEDIQQTALFNIVSVCLVWPTDFVKYASHFLVRATDPEPVWELKLEVLAIIFPHSPVHIKSLILKELEHFSQGTNKALVREAVRAIGRCAQSDAATAPRCLKLLLGQITSLDGNLAAESLTVIRHLIQQDAQGHAGTVVRLAKNLDSATDPQARATIIWLVGEFSGLNGEDNIAPDVLRILLKEFPNESPAAKQQVLLLAAKVYLHHLNRKSEAERERDADEDPPIETDTHPIVRLWEYVLLLVRYDTSFDLRDRARMYRSLLSVPQLATLMLLAEKPAPQAPSPSESRKGFTLGSATLVLAGGGGVHGLQGYSPLPDWVEEGKQPNPRLREPEGSQSSRYDVEKSSLPASERLDEAAKSVAPPSKLNGAGEAARGKTLDDWLAEEEEESEEEEEESEEESTDDEEDEEDDDEDDEEEEETDSDDDGEADRLVKS
ncbi:AP-3 complex subunit beta-2 [Neonectria ditissima]|uniref:AP complex subunit beta n=1 Tax=Neonectria ditissima TaxID=78410 RepID=A0A0P7BVB0_9HYPO|nr:AP-3 complex subunit beta-2 [Neonectria ditissima]